MVFDKEFLNPENTRFRAKAVELHISNHRLTPFEKFQRLEEGNVFPEPMRLGPAIPLFGDFTSLFTNEGTSDHVLAVLRGIVEKIEAMDTDHPPGCRHQPYEPALGPGNCIATTFTENLQAVSCEEVAVLILTLIKQLSEVNMFWSAELVECLACRSTAMVKRVCV